jgi:hypothetical protein
VRAKVLPLWPVVLAMLGPVAWPPLAELLGEMGVFVPPPVFAIGIAWLGAVLWRRARAVAGPNSPAGEISPAHHPA